MKRIFWILLTPFLIIVFGMVTWTEFVWPRLSKWGIEQAQGFAKKEAQIEFTTENLSLEFLKPTLVASKLIVKLPPSARKMAEEVTADELRVQVDPFELLLGRLVISAIIIKKPVVQVNVDPLLEGSSEPEELPLDALFKQLPQIPIRRLFIEDAQISAHLEKNQIDAQFNDLSFGLFAAKDKLHAKLEIPKFSINNKKTFLAELKVRLSASLDRKTLKVNEFKVSTKSAELDLNGELPSFHRISLEPQADLNFKSSVKLNELSEDLLSLLRKKMDMQGDVKAQGSIKLSANKKIQSEFSVNTQNVQIEQFKLGEAELKGQFVDDSLKFKKIEAVHPAGLIILNNSELQLKKDFKFKTHIEVENLNTIQLFHALGLNKIPVNIDLRANFPCEGHLSPFLTSCQGWVTAKNINVKSESNYTGKSIVEIEEMHANGQFQVDSSEVRYKADLKVANNTGKSDGVVRFEDGFKINYETPEIDFANVKNLFNLKFEGKAQIQGSTEGDSNWAVFNMGFKSKDFAFENFQMGDVSTDISFQKGQLYLRQIAGNLKQSDYAGQIDINLDHSSLLGNLDFPKTNLSDIFWILERRYPMPVNFEGNGQARIRFEGPLDFWKMSYKLESQFENGKIATESFNKAVFSVSSIDGNIHTDQVEVTKNNSRVQIEGQIGADQKLKLKAKGQNFKLEESEYINQQNQSLFGHLNFESELLGSLSEPEYKMKGQISDTVFDEQETAPSQFDLRLTKKFLDIKAQLFGDKIKSDVQWPFEKNSTPLKIQVATKDWNFTQSLSLFNSSLLKNEYSSSLTTDIDLQSSTGDFESLSGRIGIVNFFVKRGTLSLQNESPMEALFNQGDIQLDNFELRGPDNSVQFLGRHFTLQDLNVQAKVELEMRILHILMPFFDELSGPAKLTATFRGPLFKPEILGNAYLNEVFFKFKNFPHAFERVESEIVFSHSKILIDQLKGQIAGGNFHGSGNMQIQGPKDLPTTLQLKFEGVSLNIPEKVHSTGSADLTLSGRWFPFLISGTYNISSALYERELSSDESSLSQIRQSLYLPKSLKEDTSDPLAFDLNLILERPAEIKNSQVDGTATGQLLFRGTVSNPVLLGKLNLEKNTKLIFKDKVFELQTGNINFTNPTEINPELYITAQSRVSEYDINLLVQGASKNLSIKLSSLPPLAETEIVSLLALGITSSQLEQNVKSNQQAEQGATEIGSAVFSTTGLAKTLENKLGLNIQISNTFDNTKNISIPKATISGKVNKRINYYYTRTLRDSNNNEAKLQYLFSPNWSGNLSLENKQDDSTSAAEKETRSIFGLDLEFKREFR